MYVIMKTMCPPTYHHNIFMATHALGHMMYRYTLLVPMNCVSNTLIRGDKQLTFPGLKIHNV